MSEPILLSGDVIKELCSMIFADRGTLADFNLSLPSGAYSYTPDTLNSPFGGRYGVLLSFRASMLFGVEIAFRDYSNLVFYRIVWGGVKRQWYQMESKAIT